MAENREFYFGIDSDGCVFDTMEEKHKKCFIPRLIESFNLESWRPLAEAAWKQINLYSRTRGINRFKGLLQTLLLLDTAGDNKLSSKIKAYIDDNSVFISWIENELKLGHPSLENAIKAIQDQPGKSYILKDVLSWSESVNEDIRKLPPLEPFLFSRNAIGKMSRLGETSVISSTNQESLKREWGTAGLLSYIDHIHGQESGSKAVNLEMALQTGYSCEKVIMIGDAPGDLAAARSCCVRFYPIIPGRERESWQHFNGIVLDAFINGHYTAEMEDNYIENFLAALPENTTLNSEQYVLKTG